MVSVAGSPAPRRRPGRPRRRRCGSGRHGDEDAGAEGLADQRLDELGGGLALDERQADVGRRCPSTSGRLIEVAPKLLSSSEPSVPETMA